MSTTIENTQIAQAVAELELDADQAQSLTELVEGGMGLDEALAQLQAEPDDDDPERPAAKPTEQLASEPSDKQLRDLDKENVRHIASVHRIMGHFSEGLAECQECGTMGLVEPGPKPQTHPFFIPCPTCNAFGQVLTGSLVAEHTGVNCPDCAGRGFLEAMIDNTPAVEIVERLREQTRLSSPPPSAEIVLPAQPAESGALSHGRPAWMGDPTIAS